MHRTVPILALVVFAPACAMFRNLNAASGRLPILVEHTDSAVVCLEQTVADVGVNLLVLTGEIIDATTKTTKKLDELITDLMTLTKETAGAIRTQNDNMTAVMNSVRNAALAAGAGITAVTGALIAGSHWLQKRDRRKVHR